jgi:hypothetical protein
MAGWDNTVRRMLSSVAWYGATPCALSTKVVFSEGGRKREAGKIVFINAWNEWAEGTY